MEELQELDKQENPEKYETTVPDLSAEAEKEKKNTLKKEKKEEAMQAV